MFSAGQYLSTKKGYTIFFFISKNIIFSNLNLAEFLFIQFLSSLFDHFQVIKNPLRSMGGGGYQNPRGSTTKKNFFYVSR